MKENNELVVFYNAEKDGFLGKYKRQRQPSI